MIGFQISESQTSNFRLHCVTGSTVDYYLSSANGMPLSNDALPM